MIENILWKTLIENITIIRRPKIQQAPKFAKPQTYMQMMSRSENSCGK